MSISFAESNHSGEALDTWLYAVSNDPPTEADMSHPRASSAHLPLRQTLPLRVVNPSSPSPIRPAASYPPTPEPLSAVSMADSGTSGLTLHPVPSFDDAKYPSVVNRRPSGSPFPKLSLPHEAFPVRHPRGEREVEIKHPFPRRLASHPILLHRASSIASSLYPRSLCESPGPPPARSPLRLRRDNRVIETTISQDYSRKSTCRSAPGAKDGDIYHTPATPIVPTVVTDCTGPIKRPRSGDKVSSPGYPNFRKVREERTKARKLRDKPSRTIDSVVHASPPLASTPRLRKARPHIQIPDLRPVSLGRRSSSAASSNASGKKMSEYTRTPVSAVPSEDTPISPAASNLSAGAESAMGLSPVMLVAEQIPLPKGKPAAVKPTKLVVKSYAPRPRSASIPRNAFRRRSWKDGQQQPPPPTRSCSPAAPPRDTEIPPLPSPPPNRALPPTPPASGSERATRTKLSRAAAHAEAIPALPSTAKLGIRRPSPKPQTSCTHPAPHHSPPRRASPAPDDSPHTHILRKENRLLRETLAAVLNSLQDRSDAATRGAPSVATARGRTGRPGSPGSPLTAWESRVARRSAASNAASCSIASMSHASNVSAGGGQRARGVYECPEGQSV